jgi:hypothetical protein
VNLSSFHSLLTSSGQKALSAAEALTPREADFLRNLDILCRRYPKDLAQAALETAILRREAVDKFPQAGRMYFTRQALEQASGQAVSRYRCQRFAGYDTLLDLGCSIGGDTLSLASLAFTIGIDLDPLRLALARANLRSANLAADHLAPANAAEHLEADHLTPDHLAPDHLQSLAPAYESAFIQADLKGPLPLSLSNRMGGFFDPARREAGRRLHSVQRYQPPLAVIESWQPAMPALAVKLSPGVELAELERYGGELEFISLRGELKEAVLWLGPLQTAERRATLLPGSFTMAGVPDTHSGYPGRVSADVHLSEPLDYLYEPDPAILRAGLVRMLAAQLDAAQLDAEIAYLTGAQWVNTPFAQAYRVEDWLPFNLKRLRALLHQRRVERIVVKKRGSPIQPEALIRDLRLQPVNDGLGVERIIFLTHLRSQPIVVICLPDRLNSEN